MGRAGVTAWGQCRGPCGGAAVAGCLVGLWDFPRERPTPWSVDRGAGVGAPRGWRPAGGGGGGQLAVGWDLGAGRPKGEIRHAQGLGGLTCGLTPEPASPKRRRRASRDGILASSHRDADP